MTPNSPTKLSLADDLSPQAIGGLFQKAHSTHVDMVRLLVQCGRSLIGKRESLPHGQWLPWLENNRETLGFGELTAQRLMKAANTSLAKDLEPAEALRINRQIWGHAPKAKRVVSESSRSADQIARGLAFSSPATAPDSGDWKEAAHAMMEKERDATVDRVMGSSEPLKKAYEEIKRLTSMVGTLSTSRDHYMNAANNRLDEMRNWKTKAESLQRDVTGLEARNQKLEAENEALRERVAIMEVELT